MLFKLSQRILMLRGFKVSFLMFHKNRSSSVKLKSGGFQPFFPVLATSGSELPCCNRRLALLATFRSRRQQFGDYFISRFKTIPHEPQSGPSQSLLGTDHYLKGGGGRGAAKLKKKVGSEIVALPLLTVNCGPSQI